MRHAGWGSLADAPNRDWAFGEWTESPFLLGRKPKADKPPKPEVENARVSTPVVSPAKAKAICRRAQLNLGQTAPAKRGHGTPGIAPGVGRGTGWAPG